jgi:hypothetical protein
MTYFLVKRVDELCRSYGHKVAQPSPSLKFKGLGLRSKPIGPGLGPALA